ncbi:hypothetical protein DSM3645_28677 [Blastopirellula marina DSM 3645]|uniref:Uncharacterized protein n=1 Tax=Blastopirellula marina DSM 3645 TaxID=314230 RepID=A3ZPF7_9BACT|nr:hypothetical protein DSM3645_28677 [Blastopirellula marina DSM 3645]
MAMVLHRVPQRRIRRINAAPLSLLIAEHSPWPLNKHLAAGTFR